MDQQSDEERIRKSVAIQFHAILGQISASSVPPRPEVEEKIEAASDAWHAGNKDLAISLLLDALIVARRTGGVGHLQD